MPAASPNYSIVYSARMSGAATSLSVGDCIVPDSSGLYVLSTTANRGTKRSDGICLTPNSSVGGSVLMQQYGKISTEVSGLDPGAETWVRVSSLGRLERVTSPTISDDVVGWAEADGSVHLFFGIPVSRFINTGSESCSSIDDFGALGDGTTDDAPAIRLAMAAAAAAGHYRVCIPETAAFYRLGSAFRTGSYVSIFVNGPFKFIGRAGARSGTGQVQIKADAGLTAFFVAAGRAGEVGTGTGGEGAHFEGLDIRSAGLKTTVGYAASTAYSVGQLIKGNDAFLLTSGHATYTGGSEHLWEVIKAGTTTAAPEASAYDEGSSHTPDRATVWAAGQTVGAGRIVRSSNNTHWDVFFIALNSGTTHATTEPTWDYTVGNNTNDNGITWQCLTDPNILVLGTVIARVVAFHGIMAWCQVTIRDCYFKDWQNAAVMLEGNVGTPIIDSDAIGCIVEDCNAVTPLSGSGLRGVGFYLRGGGLTGARFTNCRVTGGAGSAQGLVAMPTSGTQHNHGFLDRSFLGGNAFVGCVASQCGGYDFWFQGTAAESTAYACSSNLGRVRCDTASRGDITGAKFWSVSGGPNSYASTGTSITKSGLRNAYEVDLATGLKYAGLNDGTVFNYHYDLIDSGAVGWRILSGWNYYGWASTSFSPIAIANRQVAVSANLPLGQEGGSLKHPHGYGMGAVTDEQHIFPNLTEFLGTITYNERGGYRRVGDICLRPDRVASSAYSSDIVITAGYTGPTWTASTAVLAQVVAGSSSSHLATIVAPTSGANLNRFKCTTAGTTGGSEPNWALAPSVGNTVNDGTAVWTNVGVAPVVANHGYVGTLPAGSGEANTMSSSGGTASIVQTKVGVNLPVRGFSASAPITVTQNTNDLTFGFTQPGSNTQVIFNDGGAMSGDADFTWDKTNNRLTITSALRVGTAQNTDGIGVPNNTGIYFRNSSNSADRNVLQLDSANNVRLGDASTAALVASYQGTAGFFNGSTYDVLVSAGTDIKLALPLAGNSSNSVPLRFKVASVTPTSGAGSTTTLTAAQYECPIIEFATSGDNQVCIAPATNGAFFIFRNPNVGATPVIKKSGGTGVTISAGKKAVTVYYSPAAADYVLAAEVAPS